MTPNPLIEMLVQSLAESELVLALFDPKDNLQWANRRYHEMFLRGLSLPVPFADVLRHGFHGGFGVKIDSGDVEQFLADILPRRRRAQFRKFATDTVDDRWLWMTETLQPNGWLLSSASDITDLKLRERSLREAHHEAVRSSERDPTTGALNRQQILEAVELAVANAGVGRSLCVALFNLNDYGRIFVNSGLHAAEQTLASFAKHCMSQLRPGDCLGRTGRDEFVMLLRGVRESLALRIVKRLESSLAAPGDPSPSFSVAVAELAPSDSFEALMLKVHSKAKDAQANAVVPNRNTRTG
jgi:diguanylate cyclase